jgi:hypothetical protein
VTHDITGWETNIHPLLYLGRTYEHAHRLRPIFSGFRLTALA